MAVQGNVGEGTPMMEQALAIYRSLGDKIGQADTNEALAMNNNDLERSIAYTKESLVLARELGDLAGILSHLCWLSRLVFWMGDFSSPGPWLEEAHSIARQLEDPGGEIYVISTYGEFSYWQGNYPQAIAYFENAIQSSEKFGEQYQGLWAKLKLAYTVLRQGDIQQAHEMLEDGIRGMQKADLVIGLVYAIEGLASLHLNQDQPEHAVQLFAWADKMRDKIGDHRPPIEQAAVERDLVVIHSNLNDSDFAKLSSQGQAMTIEEAVNLALEK
jgi:tetratricopeptide (TPR) repeat protein